MPYLSSIFWDPTFALLIPAMILSLIAQARISSAYNRYSDLWTARSIPAEQVAEIILRRGGVYDVDILSTSGKLTDHFDPRRRVIRLSQGVYGSASVAAVAVAAHECGHALQYACGYKPLRIRAAILPVVNIASRLSIPLLLIGIFMGVPQLAYGAAIAYGAVFVFQLVTLPVEYNASRRALAALKSEGILYDEELAGAKKVLSAAALTYVAAAFTALMQLLRL
ncbi:MAG: zinc metallopeptidase, partial [Christensenellaceae bacterium]|nr:zinc metallopeptidase [Christensenellaceae bacterium]